MGENNRIKPADVFAEHLDANFRRRVHGQLDLVRGDVNGRPGTIGFLGLARNSGGYSLPMMGTPCDVPLPRKMNKNAMIKFSFVADFQPIQFNHGCTRINTDVRRAFRE